MTKNTGKVREKSGNFVSPEKWEPCFITYIYYMLLLGKKLGDKKYEQFMDQE